MSDGNPSGIGVTGIGTTPFRAGAAEVALANKRLDRQTVDTAALHVVEGAQPLYDLFASSEYRVHLAQIYVFRALTQAASRAQG